MFHWILLSHATLSIIIIFSWTTTKSSIHDWCFINSINWMAAPTCCSGAVTSAAGMKPVFPVLCHVLTAVLFPVLITECCCECVWESWLKTCLTGPSPLLTKLETLSRADVVSMIGVSTVPEQRCALSSLQCWALSPSCDQSEQNISLLWGSNTILSDIWTDLKHSRCSQSLLGNRGVQTLALFSHETSLFMKLFMNCADRVSGESLANHVSDQTILHSDQG